MEKAMVAILAVAALVQLAEPRLTGGQASGGAGPSPFEAELAAFGLSPREVGLVIIAFHPDCVHCEAVAYDWAAWTASLADQGMEAVAVTLAPVGEGIRFAKNAGWVGKVLSAVDQPRLGPLASRTPWIFVYRPDGTLAYHGHGQHTDRADRVIDGLISQAGLDE